LSPWHRSGALSENPYRQNGREKIIDPNRNDNRNVIGTYDS